MSKRIILALGIFLKPCLEFVPVFAALLFLGALFWAKRQDPFSRHWFTVRAAGHQLDCVAVLPKPIRERPVIIYAHGSGGSLMDDGFVLRQMAELGLAVVSLDYNQTNSAVFPAELEAVQHYLARQKWADTNAVAWVGFSLGANRMFDFSVQHPELRPQLLINVSGRGVDLSTTSYQPSTFLPLLLIHSDQDEIFPIADIKRLASQLRTNGAPVQLKILHGLPHGLEPDRGVVFRCIGECCRSHLLECSSRREEAPTSKLEIGNWKLEIQTGLVTSAATNGNLIFQTYRTENAIWQNYHSLAQFEAEAPPFWLFCLPAAAWAVGCYAWKRHRRRSAIEKIKLRRHEIVLRWLAAVLAMWAVAETALHLVPPHLAVSKETLTIARRYLIQPKERADFDFLASQPIWQGQKLQTLLDHVELANYNRELINWKLHESIYRNYVLSPVIGASTSDSPSQADNSIGVAPKPIEGGQPSTGLNWRRPLWEEFYPRIRHEDSPADAARIVVRHLRERITVADSPNLLHSVPEIWLRQITDKTGFEIIYVAALRSVGVPARLNATGEAEIYADGKWQPAPQPVIMSW